MIKYKFKYLRLVLILIILSSLNSCGLYKRSDVKDNPVNVDDRVKKNIKEGRGIRFGKGEQRGGVFAFAPSNQWGRVLEEILVLFRLQIEVFLVGLFIQDWF